MEEAVVRTLEQISLAGTHWPKRELAKVVAISPWSMLRIWHAFGVQPWRTETFKIPPDPFLIDKIRDAVGLCLAPPTNTVDEPLTQDSPDRPQARPLESHGTARPRRPGKARGCSR
ncbi:hypothetical protein [Streptomyces fradiae]|uniref:hypothetical protein n=1 Tax=Streptomyces fradiae TaxID=1906 RepID=UPI0033BFE00A